MVPSQFLMRRGCGPVGDNISYLHGLWGERFQAQLFSCSLQERTLQSGIIIREMSWFQRLKIVILVSFNRSFCLKNAWTLRPLSSARSGTRKASKGSWSSPQTSSCSLTFEVKILSEFQNEWSSGPSIDLTSTWRNMFGLVGGLNKIIVPSREIIKDSVMKNVKICLRPGSAFVLRISFT